MYIEQSPRGRKGELRRLACSEFFGRPEFAFTNSNTPCAPNLKLAICTGVMLHQERAWTLSWPWGLLYTLRLGCYVHVRGNGFTRDSKLKCSKTWIASEDIMLM